MSQKSQRKQFAILAVLLGLLSFSVISQLKKDDIIIPKSSVPDRRSDYAAKATSAERLQVDLLTEEQPEFSGVKRNIFQFGGGGKPELPDNTVIPAAPPQQTVPQPPPLPQVHYLGFYYEKESGLKLAALSNNGRILVGKVGQVLGGTFQVVDIASDHVVLKLTAEGKVLRVPLGKAPPSLIDPEQAEQSE
jgi:hypothetical protein